MKRIKDLIEGEVIDITSRLNKKGEKVDYWRMVNGSPVGFQGKPGKGEMVAGNPAAVGQGKDSKPKEFSDGWKQVPGGGYDLPGGEKVRKKGKSWVLKIGSDEVDLGRKPTFPSVEKALAKHKSKAGSGAQAKVDDAVSKAQAAADEARSKLAEIRKKKEAAQKAIAASRKRRKELAAKLKKLKGESEMEMSDVLAEGLEESLRDMYPLFRLLEAFKDGHELKEHHVEILLDAGLFDVVEDEELGDAVELSEDGEAYYSEGLDFYDDAVTQLEEAGLLSADSLTEAKKPVMKTAPHGKLPKGVRDDIEGSRKDKSPSDFLDQKNKKYPVKDDGQLRLDLVMAAEKRARLNGDEAIEKKAAALRKKLQKEESVATLSAGLVSAHFPFYTVLSGFSDGSELSEEDIEHLIESGYLEDSDGDTVQLSDSGLEYLEDAGEFLDDQIDQLEEAFGLTGEEEALEESEEEPGKSEGQALEERQASDEAREIASTVAQKFVGSSVVLDELKKRGVKNPIGDLMTMLRNGELSIRSSRRSSDMRADAKLWDMVNKGKLPKDVYDVHGISQGKHFAGTGAPMADLLKIAKRKGIANPAKVVMEMLRGKDPMGLPWFNLKSRMKKSRGRKFKESLDELEGLAEAVASSKPFSLGGGRVKGRLEVSTKNSSLLRVKGLEVKFGKKSWSGEVDSFNPGLARNEREFNQDVAHKIRVEERMTPAERGKVTKLLWSHPEIQKLADS